mmetsp:Transcript_31278/g.90350  ORF Transcript_31278/g.90350 Transcript_31278/m.90350 type:complete len:290 (-) Transcript_31278:34-903(-)
MARDEPSVRRDGKTTRVTLERSALPSGRPVIPAAVEACLGGPPPARDPLTAAEAYRAHGSELWALDDISGAVGRWERALEVLGEERGKVVPHMLDELEVVVRLNAAQGYLRLERFEPARGHALVVMQLRPLCAKARFRLAEACGGLGDWRAAEEALAALDAQGDAVAASKGRQNLRRRRLAARDADRAMAARMLGAGRPKGHDPHVEPQRSEASGGPLGSRDGTSRSSEASAGASAVVGDAAGGSGVSSEAVDSSMPSAPSIALLARPSPDDSKSAVVVDSDNLLNMMD